MSEPVLLAILFADRVITENTNKKGIIGTFDKFISPIFPASFPAWAIYVAVTNIAGNHTFRINLTHVDTNTVILPINGDLNSSGLEQSIELTFNLTGIPFPYSGKYNLSVFIDNDLIGSRVLLVEELKNQGMG
jgi:hypothetical protein